MNKRQGTYRSCSRFALAIVAGLVGSELQAAVSLFNGVDLSGWTQLGGDATYSVEVGEIVGTSAQPSSPNTFLVTDQLYGDFALDVDFFISDADFNSGIQLRSQSLPSHNNGRVFGYQVEIDPSTRAWTGGLYFEGGSPDRPAGWLDDLDDNPDAQAAFVLGDWNHFRIVAEGQRIQTWINGVPAADYTDVDPAAFLPSGFIGLQVHQVSTNDPREVRWRNLVLSSIPTLAVNRETGSVTLRNDMDVAVDFEAYSISSPSGSLNAASDDPFSLIGGGSQSLAGAYQPMPTAFGVDAEDIEFEFGEALNGPRPGRVEYVGQNVANNLVLFVDPATGQVVLKNSSTFPVEIVGYSIQSDSNSLVEQNWQSLEDRGLVGWEEGPLEFPGLSELNPDQSLLLNGGDRYNFGQIYDTGLEAADLSLAFLIDGAADYSAGAVQYRFAGDFNFDQSVDGLDLQRWEDAYAVNGNADADGDGDSDGIDFLAWQRQFGLSTALVVAAPIPEPAACLLAVLGAATCLHSREACPRLNGPTLYAMERRYATT